MTRDASDNGGGRKIRISQDSALSIGLILTVLVPGGGTALWLSSRLQGIEFEIRSLRENHGEIKSAIQDGSSNYVSARDFAAWVAINRAKGVDLAELPGDGK